MFESFFCGFLEGRDPGVHLLLVDGLEEMLRGRGNHLHHHMWGKERSETVTKHKGQTYPLTLVDIERSMQSPKTTFPNTGHYF